MIWTLLAVVAVFDVFYGMFVWRRHTARAEQLAGTDPEQAATIRRAALNLVLVLFASPFLILIVGWLAFGPPDFTW